MNLWYKEPAKVWEEALPVGNGRLGAMVFGKVQKETLLLNDDSIWYGKPIDRINPDAYPNLEQVRKYILDGNIHKAEQLLCRAFSGVPQSQRPYQPLGQLDITMQGLDGEVKDYERSLELEKGLAKTIFSINGITYSREVFSSYPDKLLILHLSASEKGKINFDLLMTRERFYDNTGKLNNHSIYMDGNLSKGGIDFWVGVSAQIEGGEVCVIGEHLVVEGANRVTLFLGAETTFYEKNPEQLVKNRLEQAQKSGYEEIRRRHIEDFHNLMGNVTLKLTESENSKLPTNERMKAFGEGKKDNALAALYFQYGRYLLASSSRPGTLPANLQGIWNNEMKPSWDSKYTININMEMNYWLAEAGNLSECHMPLFEHLERLVETGKKTAKKMYGCRGFCAHHNTDIWADSAPQDIYIPATYWTQGGAWLCTHLWLHYQYTEEKKWLREVAYPIMREAVLFYQDFLIEKDGFLVTCPSVSPENTYILEEGQNKDRISMNSAQYASYIDNKNTACICYGPTMDNQILRDLFSQFICTVKELEIQDELEMRVANMMSQLRPNQIGKNGQIMEWVKDYEEAEPGHRHISQLYGLHPSRQISVDKTPNLAEAARKTIQRRLEHGGGHTGWSCAWILNFYTRLHDGNTALSFLHRLIQQSTFPNLMDNHPRKDGYVFQIDGNLGAAAGIAEMLVQCDEEKIWLLPALPDEWEDGEVKGLCVFHKATIDISWRRGNLEEVDLHSDYPFEVTLKYKEKDMKVMAGYGKIKWNM